MPPTLMRGAARFQSVVPVTTSFPPPGAYVSKRRPDRLWRKATYEQPVDREQRIDSHKVLGKESAEFYCFRIRGREVVSRPEPPLE